MVIDRMRNGIKCPLQESPTLQWWRKWKSDSESTSGIGSRPKVNHF